MRHAISTHLFVNHRLNTIWLDRISKAGIPAVEIFCARQSFDWRNRAQVDELAIWFRDADLRAHSCHSPLYTDDCWGRSGPHSVLTITETSKPLRVAMVDEIKRALEVSEKIPFQYFIQHLGVVGEEWDDRKIDAAFTCLEDLKVFASQRGVEILLENTPNAMSSSERLLQFLELTHLDLHFCFDVGHAHIMEGVEPAFERMKDRIRSTHVHANDGTTDTHLFPYLADNDSIDWALVMRLLHSREDQYPLLLEIKEVPGWDELLARVNQVFERLEDE